MKKAIMKINWRMVITTMVILVMTVFGTMLSEDVWYETTTTAIWITGMIIIAVIGLSKDWIKLTKEALNILKDEIKYLEEIAD